MPWAGNARNVAGVNVRALLHRLEVQDALVALVFTASTVVVTIGIDAAEGGPALDVVGYLSMVVVGGALTFRHRWPVPVLYATLAGLVVYLSRGYPGGPVFLGVFIAIGTVASLMTTRRAVPHAVAAVAALAVAAVVRGSTGSGDPTDDNVWAHLLYLSWSVVAFLIGKAIRDRRELLAGLRERNRHLEETREEEALRRVAEERVRIARDLHDIVAHNIAGISLQAATGAHVAEAHPEQAHQALLAIREASKQTLDELRSTLYLLREGEDTAPLAPSPGLDALPTLVASVEAAGIPVELEVAGDVSDVPDVVAGATFRIVQESLTNVMRHAGPAAASVRLESSAEGIDLRIEDDGRGASAPVDGTPAGHGLEGMRERALALGGTVDAGPRRGGGYAVHAWLPVRHDAEPEPEAPAPEGGTHGEPPAKPHPEGARGVRA